MLRIWYFCLLSWPRATFIALLQLLLTHHILFKKLLRRPQHDFRRPNQPFVNFDYDSSINLSSCQVTSTEEANAQYSSIMFREIIQQVFLLIPEDKEVVKVYLFFWEFLLHAFNLNSHRHTRVYTTLKSQTS